MYNVTATIGPLVGKQIGYSSSVGQCGALASYWLSVLTDKVYQFAYGMSGINAKWVPESDCSTAWNVYTQTNWSAIGFEKIDNPSFSQLKAGDIFFISARDGLSTGHVGIVASVANGNVVTYEQNVLGAMYVQELPDDNSWSWYNGFSGVVRKKEEKPSTDGGTSNKIQLGGLQMFIQYPDGKQYVISSTGKNYIETSEQSKIMTQFFGKPKIVGKDINQREIDQVLEALTGGTK
ncbi:CHAP domain-containing protein [Lactococcus garvieae]|uniref:CHAP domain-containing protein n=1 Tax=Lactococcus garvieae TaxID=1363 RepID=UPI003853ED6D